MSEIRMILALCIAATVSSNSVFASDYVTRKHLDDSLEIKTTKKMNLPADRQINDLHLVSSRNRLDDLHGHDKESGDHSSSLFMQKMIARLLTEEIASPKSPVDLLKNNKEEAKTVLAVEGKGEKDVESKNNNVKADKDADKKTNESPKKEGNVVNSSQEAVKVEADKNSGVSKDKEVKANLTDKLADVTISTKVNDPKLGSEKIDDIKHLVKTESVASQTDKDESKTETNALQPDNHMIKDQDKQLDGDQKQSENKDLANKNENKLKKNAVDDIKTGKKETSTDSSDKDKVKTSAPEIKDDKNKSIDKKEGLTQKEETDATPVLKDAIKEKTEVLSSNVVKDSTAKADAKIPGEGKIEATKSNSNNVIDTTNIGSEKNSDNNKNKSSDSTKKDTVIDTNDKKKTTNEQPVNPSEDNSKKPEADPKKGADIEEVKASNHKESEENQKPQTTQITKKVDEVKGKTDNELKGDPKTASQNTDKDIGKSSETKQSDTNASSYTAKNTINENVVKVENRQVFGVKDEKLKNKDNVINEPKNNVDGTSRASVSIQDPKSSNNLEISTNKTGTDESNKKKPIVESSTNEQQNTRYELGGDKDTTKTGNEKKPQDISQEVDKKDESKVKEKVADKPTSSQDNNSASKETGKADNDKKDGKQSASNAKTSNEKNDLDDQPLKNPSPIESSKTDDLKGNTKDDNPTKEDVAEIVDQALKNKDKIKVVDTTVKTTDPNAVVLDKEYIIENKVLSYKLDSDLAEDEYIVLKLSGIGEVNFGIVNSIKPHITVTNILNVQGLIVPNFMPISGLYLKKDSSIALSSTKLILSKLKVNIQRLKFLTLNFNENVKIFPLYSELIRVKISSPAVIASNAGSSRLQFIVESSLKEQHLSRQQELGMFINQKKDVFPKPEDAEMKASGSLGYGLIKTLSTRDPFYCVDPLCSYKVTLKAKNINSCNFYPTVFENGSEIRFNSSLSLTEELEVQDVVIYKLMVPKSDDNWLFTLVPTEGSPVMNINPDNKPNNLEGYAYKSTGRGTQNVLITSKEAAFKRYTNSVFYVAYHTMNSSKVSTLKFEARRERSNIPFELKENASYSGTLFEKEIVRYSLNLKTAHTEMVTADIKLSVKSNDVFMIVKECLESEAGCTITEEDVKNTKLTDIQASYPNRIIKKTMPNEAITRDTELHILLKFMCKGDKTISKENKNFPTSASCRFAVGLVGVAKGKNMEGNYTLTFKSQGRLINAEAKTPIQLVMKAEEMVYYKFSVSREIKNNFKYFTLQVTALTGTCNLYLSKTSDTPNKNDFENVVEVKDDNVTSLETLIYYSSLAIDRLPLDNSVYLAASGVDYCIIEIFADFTNTLGNSKNLIQTVEENHIVISHMDDDDLVESATGKLYSKLFLFKVPAYEREIGYLTIIVNANRLGLSICVQDNVETFDIMKGCDYFKDSDVLVVPRLYKSEDAGSKLFISVRRSYKEGASLSAFPVEFSLTVSFDRTANPNIKMIAAGQSHTKLLPASSSVTYQLNANHMNESGLVLLSTDHPSITAFITTSINDSDEPIAILSHLKFAMRIRQASRFKEANCRDSNCILYVKINNPSEHNYRFTLTYTVDNLPIALKDGAQIFIPIDMPQYFITEADSNESLELNLFSESTSGVVYSKILSINEIRKDYIFELLNETKFDYKSEVDNEVEVAQTPGELAKFSPPVVGYYYVPKADVSKHEDMVVIYDQSDRAKVRIHSKVLRLEPYYQTKFSTDKNDFSYFYVTMDEVQGFSVILSVISGEADLYINPGMFNFTRTDSYWIKSAGYKGDEIVITPGMFDNPNKIAETYTIGVHARTASEYSILFMPEFSNLIKMQYQNLVYLQFEADKYYYFDFFNKHQTFTTYFHSENSNAEISVLNYNEGKSQEFIDMISKEENYTSKFYFLHGSAPLKHQSSNGDDVGTHYVIRVKALGVDSKTTLAIYDQTRPIQAYSEKRFYFAQKLDEEQVFNVKLDGDYSSVDIDIRVDHGTIDVLISNKDKFEGSTISVDGPSQKYINYKVQSDNIVLLSEVFIKINSRTDSNYSIQVRPAGKFKELKAYKTEIVYTSKDDEQYMFFNLDKKTLDLTSSLYIEIYNVSFFNDKPELLFLAKSDVSLASDSLFIPMPLVDYFESDMGVLKHSQIIPELMPGYYVIKISKNSVRVPIKISVNINNMKQIEPNSIYRQRLTPKTRNVNTYEMYLPEAGEFRLLVQTCSDAVVDFAKFTTDAAFKIIEFNENFSQSHLFVTLDKRNKDDWERGQREIVYSIKKGIVDAPGLVQFNITSSGLSSFSNASIKLDYFLISEFKPSKRSLFMKDYIDIYTDKEALDNFKVAFNYTDHDTQLSLMSTLPKIKSQMLQDYPKVQKVKYRVNYYMLPGSSEFAESLSTFGFAAIETVKSRSHVQERITSLKEAMQEDISFDMYFTKEDLKTFEDDLFLSVYTRLEVYFFESEDEQFGISLDLKMAQMPYFLVTIPNYYRKFWMAQAVFIIALNILGAILVYLVVYLATLCKKKGTERDYECSPSSVIDFEDSSHSRLNVMDDSSIE